ncbi:MAG: alpha/beta hydrolase, partial [Alphaproteobacteria bacterium]
MYQLIITGLVIYGALVGGLFLVQRQLMYFPDTRTPEPARAGVPEMREVALTTEDGLRLMAWYRPAQTPDGPVIVFFHGNAGNIGNRGAKIRPFIVAGFGVMLLSYRGYGGNPGSPTEEGLNRDGRAALEFLSNNGVPSRRAVLYGESLGSGVAVEMATERPVGGVVLEAPFTSVADVAASQFFFVPARYLVRDRFDSLSKIDAIGAPLLILHGERDRTIPVRYGRRLFAAARQPKKSLFYPR